MTPVHLSLNLVFGGYIVLEKTVGNVPVNSSVKSNSFRICLISRSCHAVNLTQNSHLLRADISQLRAAPALELSCGQENR
jgi:hypothetical protein